MQWYRGDIAEAVATSKTRNAIFVVYVEGKDEKSKALTTLIDENEIKEKLQSDIFVAIKIESGSISHTQFAAIYKNVPSPSIFFIGKNGKPISIISEPKTVPGFSKELDTIIETHTGIAPVKQNSASAVSENLIQSERNKDTVPEKPPNVTCENGVCYKIPDSSIPSSSNSTKPESTVKQESNVFIQEEKKTDETKTVQLEDKKIEEKKAPEEKKVEEEKHEENTVPGEQVSTKETTEEEAFDEDKKELSKEEKIQRAKEIMEKKREIKKQEEEEKEKLKEIERRKLGQDVQKLRRWQQDEELKTLMEERQRAKKEEKAARERILAQIAQDKADRAARFGNIQPPSPSATTPEVQQRNVPQSSNSNSAKLQFRLPDGSSYTHEFSADDTLQEVRNFVGQNMSLPFRSFSLLTTFPRREFTPEQDSDTLRDLELCPNAVVLILPGNTGGTVAAVDGGGFMAYLWLLLAPILNLFGFFRNLIFGEPQPQEPSTNERSGKQKDTTSEHSPQMSVRRRHPEATAIRRQGNIHRLTDRTDSDDDTNTWNGNSTQQM